MSPDSPNTSLELLRTHRRRTLPRSDEMLAHRAGGIGAAVVLTIAAFVSYGRPHLWVTMVTLFVALVAASQPMVPWALAGLAGIRRRQARRAVLSYMTQNLSSLSVSAFNSMMTELALGVQTPEFERLILTVVPAGCDPARTLAAARRLVDGPGLQDDTMGAFVAACGAAAVRGPR